MKESILARAEIPLPPPIFEVPEIKTRVDALFEEMEDDIKSKFNEIKTFIIKDEFHREMYGEISYDDVITLFKMNFYKFILNKAGKDTVVENILEILSKEKLKDAILGEPMINAFSMCIRLLPTDDAMIVCLHGGTIILLEKEFLGKWSFLSCMPTNQDD